MKTIDLVEGDTNENGQRYRFQEHEESVFTLVFDLTDSGRKFLIEIRDPDEDLTFGLDERESLFELNQAIQLCSTGKPFSIAQSGSGLFYCMLDLSDSKYPKLLIRKEEEKVEPQETGLAHFLNSKLPVTLEIGRQTMMTHQVLSLGQGAIIELNQMVGEALDVYVGEELVAKAEVVIMPDQTFGARVVKVLPIARELADSQMKETDNERE